MSALREVLAVFDIVVNDSQLEAANKKIDTFVDGLKKAAEAFAVFKITEKIVEFGQHVAEAAREAEFGAMRIGLGVNEYQKLAQVAENYGMKVEGLQIATRMLIRGLSDAGGTMGTFSSRTHFAKDALHNLGVDAGQFKGKGLDEILPVIADGFSKIPDPIERTAIALRLFGHRGLSILPMMAAGGEELRRQFAAAVPVFEEATIKSANEATIAGKQLGRVWDNLINNSFGKALLDATTIVSKALTDFVLILKDISKNSEIGKATVTVLATTLVAAAAMIIVAWWPVLAPILAVTAALAALALLIDDIIVFFEGGKSVIGDALDEMFGPGGAERARKAISEAWDTFKAFLEDLKTSAVPPIIDKLKEGLERIRQLISEIKSTWDGIKGIADYIANKTGLTDENIIKVGRQAASLGGEVVEGTKQLLGISSGPGGAPASVAPAPSISVVPRDDSGTGAMLSPTYNFINPIDSAELGRKVSEVAGEHTNAALGQALRDAHAAAGGAK